MSNLKYISFGLIIGVIIATIGIVIVVVFGAPFSSPGSVNALFVPSLVPTLPSTQTQPPLPTLTRTPKPLPTSTFTTTPTSIILPTVTLPASPTPLGTPDAVQSTINNGGLIFTGPLSNAQQISLYKASLNYIEPTVLDSIRKSKEINGVGYGDPSNICGPLAIAIMRDAGILVNTRVTPHDFWLLNPFASEDKKLIDRVFPTGHYLHIKFPTPINKITWRNFPLQPGDFIFIWHGSGGNFDHMLVVTRVDSNLDTYSVTNYGTKDGFVLAETLLYNPSDPNVGIFHTWTQERDAILGSTGFGGFELWRLLPQP